MDRNPYSPPSADVDLPDPRPISMVDSGLRCFLVLLAYVVLGVTIRMLFGIQPSPYILIAALFVAIHSCAWHFVQARRRNLLPSERGRFLLACFIAFWVLDELLPLVREIPSVSAYRLISRVVGATVVDLCLVAIIVLLTVPWATKQWEARLRKAPLAGTSASAESNDPRGGQVS
jgi:hypothetical protein